MSPNTSSKMMKIVAVVFGIYALMWGTAPFTEINFPARLILDMSNWPIDNLDTEFDQNMKWLSAIGAGLLGFVAIVLGGITAPAIRDGNRTIIRTTIISMSAWYIIDGLGSVAAGVSSNVVFNSIYLAVVLIPLIWIKYPTPHEA